MLSTVSHDIEAAVPERAIAFLALARVSTSWALNRRVEGFRSVPSDPLAVSSSPKIFSRDAGLSDADPGDGDARTSHPNQPMPLFS